MDDGPSAEGKRKHQKMGIKSIGRNSFPGSVYGRPCPRCGAEPWEWCCSELGERISEPHRERSGPPTMAKPR
jgi:hypothetical protein